MHREPDSQYSEPSLSPMPSALHQPPTSNPEIGPGEQALANDRESSEGDAISQSLVDGDVGDSPIKKHPHVEEEQISASSSITFEPPPISVKPVDWTLSIFRLGPLAGLMALCFAFCQVWAAFAVLWASHNQPTSSWRYQPNVYLAILTAISNKALAFAAVKGTIITWWLKATRGTTIHQLQHDWSVGLFTYKAIAAGRHFNILALACLLATIVAIDGPLLQRASTVHSKTPTKSIDLNVNVSPEMPQYLSGGTDFAHGPDGKGITFTLSEDFMHIINDYAHGVPITNGVSGCPEGQACAATIRAPALALESCQTTLVYMNYTEPLSGFEFNENSLPIVDREVFFVRATVEKGSAERLIITTKLSDHVVAKTCAGHLNITDCYYTSAIGEYSIVLVDGGITFPEGFRSPKIVALANNTALTNASIAKYDLYDSSYRETVTTLSGVANAADFKFASIVSVEPGTGGHVAISEGEVPWFPFQHLTNFVSLDCAPAWSDPRPDVEEGLNEVMVRAGVRFAQSLTSDKLLSAIDPGLAFQYNITGHQTGKINVFHSDFSYFVGAAVVELVTILVILWTFYGWWRLGRDTSFSPLEIAKSFDAPLLQGEKSNLNGDDLANNDKDRKVRYGKVDGDPRRGDAAGAYREEKLVFGDEGDVRPVNYAKSQV